MIPLTKHEFQAQWKDLGHCPSRTVLKEREQREFHRVQTIGKMFYKGGGPEMPICTAWSLSLSSCPCSRKTSISLKPELLSRRHRALNALPSCELGAKTLFSLGFSAR